MNLTTKALIVTAALALAACQNPRAGMQAGIGAGAGVGTGAFGPGGIGMTELGDPNDPRSIAHFNQRVGDRVFFETDQTTLTPTAQETLRRQAAWLNQNSQYAIMIEGHADERGTREYNVALGAQRANAVQNYLVQQGVSAGRIRTTSFGKERPVEACPAPRCWNQNRRAVTVLAR
jgi:peptidoglycan-associated lipoprotein